MRGSSPVVVALLLAFAPSVGTSSASDPMPSKLIGEREVQFLPESSMKVVAGKVEGADVPIDLRRELEAYLQAPDRGGCVRLVPFIRHTTPPVERATIPQAVNGAEGVMIGTVTGVQAGFRATGEGGTLIRVRSDRVYKGGWLRERGTYFIFIPIGRIVVGGRTLCAEAPDWAGLPELDDEVLVFVPYQGWSDGAFLELIDDRGLAIVKPATSEALIPRNLRASGAATQTRDGLLEVVAESLASERNY